MQLRFDRPLHYSTLMRVVMCPVQVSFVGQTEEAAREAAQEGGYGDKIKVAKTSFKANSKASYLSHPPSAVFMLTSPDRNGIFTQFWAH